MWICILRRIVALVALNLTVVLSAQQLDKPRRQLSEREPVPAGEPSGIRKDYVAAKGVGSFEIIRSSLDAGGGPATSFSADFVLVGTIGQTDAGMMTGGDFTLTGGFRSADAVVEFVFSDGFESGDTTAWAETGGKEHGR